MSVESEQCLAEVCSLFEYMTDRGETSDFNGANNLSPEQHVRWASTITQLPYLDVVFNGRMIRLEATDLGPHVHSFEDGLCQVCRFYDEDEDDVDEDALSQASERAIQVKATRGRPQ